jgi:CheY-like chemotaxis protein
MLVVSLKASTQPKYIKIKHEQLSSKYRRDISISTEVQMRILVVDDCDDSRDLIEAALLSAGYGNVLASPSAWEALKVLDIGSTSADRPAVDLVLLDIVMPEMDGTEACARIRSDSRYADLPIIMLTSLEDGDALAKAFGAAPPITSGSRSSASS